MDVFLRPFDLLIITLAGCINQRQIEINDYLREQNRVLREQLGKKQLRLTDGHRRRLAVKGKVRGLTIGITLREILHRRRASAT